MGTITTEALTGEKPYTVERNSAVQQSLTNHIKPAYKLKIVFII